AGACIAARLLRRGVRLDRDAHAHRSRASARAARSQQRAVRVPDRRRRADALPERRSLRALGAHARGARRDPRASAQVSRARSARPDRREDDRGLPRAPAPQLLCRLSAADEGRGPVLRGGRRGRRAEHARPGLIRARVRAAALAAPILCAIALALSPARAAAHRLAPALLSMDEQPDGAIAVSFKMPSQQPVGAEIEPELPESCAPIERPRVEIDAQSITVRWAARCGDAGIVGMRFGVRGLGEAGTNALLRGALRGGRREPAGLPGGGSPPGVSGPPAGAPGGAGHPRLGVLHIATGFDHLLFVFGLVLLARGTRRLLWTVTAFTAGHSVTLSLAALGVVRFPTAPIEVAIALTILVLALELARGTEGSNRESRLRRRPWAVAFALRPLPGFGFAGAP